MKRLISLFIIIPFLLGGVSLVSAQENTVQEGVSSNPQQDYVPLATIPGFTDQGPSQDLGTYVNNIYQISIALGAVAAIMMIVIGGMQYMGTDIFSKKGQGRERITNALLGLGLLLVAFLILNTLNNDLIDLDVDLRKAAVQGNFDDIYSELLNVNNIETFLEQQGALLQEYQDAGYARFGCALDGNWFWANKIDLGEGRQAAVNTVIKQSKECSGERERIAGQFKDNSYTQCVSVYDGGRIKSCYFLRRPAPKKDCKDCQSAETLVGITMGQNVCAKTNNDSTCQVSKSLKKPLEATAENLDGVRVTLTEGYPPTIRHKAACHQDGTCVDFRISPAQTIPSSANMYTTIETWENAGGQAVFEVKTRQEKETILANFSGTPEQKDRLSRHVCVVPKITGPHFSGYSQAGTQSNCDGF